MTDADGEPPAFEVFADGAVGVGGCVIDTAHGRVDARLDVQLDAVALLLREALPIEISASGSDRDVSEGSNAA
jgi:flagellar biosynthesis/type III secretory pathway protein FliH